MNAKILAAALSLAATTQFAMAQARTQAPRTEAAASTDTRPRTLGDESSAAAAATSATTGELQVKFTIKLTQPVPTNGSLICVFDANLDDITTAVNNVITESSQVKATVSGSTATCNPKIHYQWYLPNAANDTINLSYVLEMVGPASSTSAAVLSRFSSQYIPGAGAVKVPSNGSSLSYTVSATL